MQSQQIQDCCSITCNKGGQHKGEPIKIVCLNPLCKNDNLGCIICKKSLHNRHETITIKYLYDLIEQKQRQNNVQPEIHSEYDKPFENDTIEQQCLHSFFQFKKYTIFKLQKYEEKILQFFQACKNNLQFNANNNFNSNPQSAHISGIQSINVGDLKRETSLSSLKSQVNKILGSTVIINGQIIQLNLNKSTLQQQTQANDNQVIETEFSQQMIQSLKQMHNSISEEYKKIINFLPQKTSPNTNPPSLARKLGNDSPIPIANPNPNTSGMSENIVKMTQGEYNDLHQRQVIQSQYLSQSLQQPQIQAQMYSQRQQYQQKQQSFQQPGQLINIPQETSNSFQLQQQQISLQPQQLQSQQSVLDSQFASRKSTNFNIVDYDSKCLLSKRSAPAVNQFEMQFLEKKEKEITIEQQKPPLKFSVQMKHPKINLSNQFMCCQSAPNTKKSKLVLLEPSLESLPLQECTFSFKVVHCKSLQYSAPLAIGICHQKTVETNNYEFEEENIKDPSLAKSLDSFKSSTYSKSYSICKEGADHGCYLLSSIGIVRNTYDKKQDMRKAKIRFNSGDLIICNFNPFKKQISFKRVGADEKCVLNFNIKKNDKLYACVRVSYSDDLVEIIS